MSYSKGEVAIWLESCIIVFQYQVALSFVIAHVHSPTFSSSGYIVQLNGTLARVFWPLFSESGPPGILVSLQR